MFDINEIRESLKNHVFINNIDTVPKGHARINTNFLYPDGSSIDVFLDKARFSGNNRQLKLTDFGSTLNWLDHLIFNPLTTESYKCHSESLFGNYTCEMNNGAIEKYVDKLDDLAMGIFQISQACVRFADLIYANTERHVNVVNMKAIISPYAQIHGKRHSITSPLVQITPAARSEF